MIALTLKNNYQCPNSDRTVHMDDINILEQRFGPLKKAISQEGGNEGSRTWEKQRKPASLCELCSGSARKLSFLMQAGAGAPFSQLAKSFTILWVVDEWGKFHLAVEELAAVGDETIDEGFAIRRNFPADIAGERKLGHPCLVESEQARAAGELYLDDLDGEYGWYLNFNSGRFHREPARRPSEEHISNIAQHFANKLELDIHLDLPGDFS